MQLIKVYKGKLSEVSEQIKKEKNEYLAKSSEYVPEVASIHGD